MLDTFYGLICGVKAGVLTEDDVDGERGFVRAARINTSVGSIIHVDCRSWIFTTNFQLSPRNLLTPARCVKVDTLLSKGRSKTFHGGISGS